MALRHAPHRSPFSHPVSIHLVDAFTTAPFKGNPAGVCVFDSSYTSWSTIPESWMQQVALEMNQAETAFIVRCPSDSSTAEGAQRFLLRWFTPAAEVDLCGHATLASSHLLFSSDIVSTRDEIQFDTRSGILTARVVPVTDTAFLTIELDFPADPPVLLSPSSAEYKELLPVLSRAFAPTVPASSITEVYKGKFDYLVLLPSAALVMGVKPDFNALATVKTRGVGVTARGDETTAAAAAGRGRGADCISRFFAPALGINEDPVTGSAHCMLAVLWGEKLSKKQLLGYQASARGGEVRMQWEGDRVKLRGIAVTTMSGQMLL